MPTKKFGQHQIIEHPKAVEKMLRELCADIPKSGKALEKRKYAFSAREEVPTISGRDLLAVAEKKKIEIPTDLEILLRKRAVRTISGVSPIGILTKPFPCPGKCVYCPTEVRMPKSYLSSQPAAARAVRNKFHPYEQVKNRILALKESGHPTSKLELIVMGGTWSFLPKHYQSWYIKKCFDAANDVKTQHAESLAEAQKINETAKQRIIGITLETRPDFITEKELLRMRKLGCTRLEMGVQTLDDDVQKLTKRGHTRKEVIRATKLLKDFGFKICYHLMPGLPGSTPEKDLAWMQEVFENPDFCPDFVKVYPCVVLDNSELKNWWEKGKFQPIEEKELIKLLLQFKKTVPPWARIMRLMRDIPADDVIGGVTLSNLRQVIKHQPEKLQQLVGKEFFKKNNLDPHAWPCQCVRCREVGFTQINSSKTSLEGEKPVLKRRDYDASEGKEVFLSYESPDEKVIYALLRLRLPSRRDSRISPAVLDDAALIREVHSYGHEKSVGEGAGIGQHRGLGKKLITEAERIAREEWKKKKITIISGIGTREYYQKLGYKIKSTYMTKSL